MMESTGSLVVEGEMIDAKGDAMFIHAIQCMRPDAVSLGWYIKDQLMRVDRFEVELCFLHQWWWARTWEAWESPRYPDGVLDHSESMFLSTGAEEEPCNRKHRCRDYQR